MKKGLKVVLIVLEVIFIALSVCGGAYAVYYGVLFACEGDSVDPFIAATMLGYCFIAIIASVQFLLPAVSLRVLRKSFNSETRMPSLPGIIALISSVIGNLVFYMVLIFERYRLWLGFCDNSVANAIIDAGIIVWKIFTVICLASLIVSVVLNAKNKRRLKAAAIQGGPAADGTDQKLS